MMRLVLVLLLIGVACGLDDSNSGSEVAILQLGEELEEKRKPQWFSTFASDFVSDWKRTSGTFAIKEHVGQRIEFKDGSFDHLCRVVHRNTSCVELTTKGFRYLVFPEQRDCCACCKYVNSTYLCGGPLSPNWLKSAKYLGVENVKGVACHKWNVAGLAKSKNLYFERVDNGHPCEIDGANYLDKPSERADDQYIFDDNTFTVDVSSKLFDVPDICINARMCGGGVCDQ